MFTIRARTTTLALLFVTLTAGVVWLFLPSDPLQPDETPHSRPEARDEAFTTRLVGRCSPEPETRPIPAASERGDEVRGARRWVLRGVVVTHANEEPRADAVVSARIDAKHEVVQQVRSAGDGTFEIDVTAIRNVLQAAGSYLSVSAATEEDGLLSHPAAASPESLADEVPLVLRLRRFPTVLLRAVSAGGDRLEHAEFNCYRTGPLPGDTDPVGSGAAYPVSSLLSSNARGERRTRLAAGRYWIRARKGPSDAWGEPERIEIQGGDDSQTVVLATPDATGSCRLRFVADDGQVIPGAWLALSQRDYGIRDSVVRAGTLGGRLGVDFAVTGFENLFLYADEQGVLELTLPSDPGAPLVVCVGTPFHVQRRLELLGDPSGPTERPVHLQARPEIAIRVLDLPVSPDVLARVHVSLRSTTPAAPGNPTDCSAAYYLEAALGRCFVVPTDVPGVWRGYAVGPGEHVASAWVPGSPAGWKTFEIPMGHPSLAVDIQMPHLRRILVDLPPSGTTPGALWGDEPRALKIHVGRGGTWRWAGEWIPSYQGPKELWLADGEDRLLVLGETALDDLPGGPVRIGIDEIRGEIFALPVDLRELALLRVRVEGRIPTADGGQETDVHVHRRQPLDPLDVVQATRRGRPQGSSFELEVEEASLRLAPGTYTLIARQGPRASEEVTVVLTAGAHTDAILSLAR